MHLRVLPVLLSLVIASSTPALAHGRGSWPMAGHDIHNSNNNPTERSLGTRTISALRQTWYYSARNPYQVIATAARIYALVPHGRAGALVILDARTGKLLHLLTAATLHLTPGDDLAALTYVRGEVIVGGGLRSVVAVDAASGRFRWRAQASGIYLAADGNTIYTGKGCQEVPKSCGLLASYAINARTGRILWQHPGNGGGPPVVVAGRLYQRWGIERGNTRVYDPHSGAPVATLLLDATWTGDGQSACALVQNAVQNSPAWIGRIAADGRPAWKFQLGHVSPLVGGLAFAGGAVFTASNRFHPGVVALGAARGKFLWGADVGPTRQLIVANGLLFALRTDGATAILDSSTGRSIRRLAAPAVLQPDVAPIYSELIANGTLYDVGENGIVALKP